MSYLKFSWYPNTTQLNFRWLNFSSRWSKQVLNSADCRSGGCWRLSSYQLVVWLWSSQFVRNNFLLLLDGLMIHGKGAHEMREVFSCKEKPQKPPFIPLSSSLFFFSFIFFVIFVSFPSFLISPSFVIAAAAACVCSTVMGWWEWGADWRSDLR